MKINNQGQVILGLVYITGLWSLLHLVENNGFAEEWTWDPVLTIHETDV